MKYLTCPVCGLNKSLDDFDICPCCGTEFGYSDCSTGHEQLRMRWIKLGANWWSNTTPTPNGWDPIAQLIQAKVLPVEISASKDASTETTTKFIGWGFNPQLDMRVA